MRKPMEIVCVEVALAAFKDLMTAEVEEFWALALGPKKAVLQSRMIFRGTIDACLVHPRDVFRFACTENASSLIVAHNHPSNDPIPSPQDIALTRRLIQVSRIIEIPLIDHLIVTRSGYASFARERWCDFGRGRRQRAPPGWPGSPF